MSKSWLNSTLAHVCCYDQTFLIRMYHWPIFSPFCGSTWKVRERYRERSLVANGQLPCQILSTGEQLCTCFLQILAWFGGHLSPFFLKYIYQILKQARKSQKRRKDSCFQWPAVWANNFPLHWQPLRQIQKSTNFKPQTPDHT